jgi:hypothetical protein
MGLFFSTSADANSGEGAPEASANDRTVSYRDLHNILYVTRFDFGCEMGQVNNLK